MNRKEKIYTYVLAVLIGLMVALLFLVITDYPAHAEDEMQPHITYTNFDGNTLYGYADVPAGEYYVRVTIYMDSNMCIWIFCPIDQYGGWYMYIFAPCKYISAVVTDSNLQPCIQDESAELCVYAKGE